MRPTLEPIADVRPSTYNPRQADEARLALVELSLRKLGFVLPLYATAEGELLSGHQRHHVADERLKWDAVPVVRIPLRELAERKAVNLLFNTSTNDAGRALDRQAIVAMDERIRELSDLLPDQEDRYRCMTPEAVPLAELIAANPSPTRYQQQMGAALLRLGVTMPVVATTSRKIVNGLGRLAGAAQHRHDTIDVVTIGEAEAELATLLLNKLSMDFDMRRYSDELRHNAFRRARAYRKSLGLGFVLPLFRQQNKLRAAHEFRDGDPAEVAAWKRLHGLSVVDFGSGRGEDTERLRAMGVHVATFEPFFAPEGKDVSSALSRERAETFLADVASGRPYTSVFCSTVFNSIPFPEDRRHVAAILAALTGRGRCYLSTKGLWHSSWTDTARSHPSNEHEGMIGLKLDHESGSMLTEYSASSHTQAKPKLQKYHGAQELYELMRSAFHRVEVRPVKNLLCATCEDPSVTADQLEAALRFEFDLLYADGSRMGLAERAIDAFRIRLAAL